MERNRVIVKAGVATSKRVAKSLGVVFVALLLAACAGLSQTTDSVDGKSPGTTGSANRQTDLASVTDKTWLWFATNTVTESITVAEPARYTVALLSDGKVQARFDCNRGGGSYRADTGKLSLGPLMATRMMCPPDSQAESFMRDLALVGSFFVQNGELHLVLKAQGGIMRFQSSR